MFLASIDRYEAGAMCALGKKLRALLTKPFTTFYSLKPETSLLPTLGLQPDLGFGRSYREKENARSSLKHPSMASTDSVLIFGVC